MIKFQPGLISFDKFICVQELSQKVANFLNSKNSECGIISIFCRNIGLSQLFECIYDKQNQTESFYVHSILVMYASPANMKIKRNKIISSIIYI